MKTILVGAATVMVFFLAGCGGSEDAPAAGGEGVQAEAASPSESPRPLLGDGTQEPLYVAPAVPIPSPTGTAGSEAVTPSSAPAGDVLFRWTKMAGAADAGKTKELGSFPVGSTQYVLVTLPKNSQMQVVTRSSQNDAGTTTARMAVVAVDAPGKATCDEGLVYGTPESERIVDDAGDPSSPSAGGTGKVSGTRVCVAVTLPDARTGTGAPVAVSMTWSNPKIADPADWIITLFESVG